MENQNIQLQNLNNYALGAASGAALYGVGMNTLPKLYKKPVLKMMDAIPNNDVFKQAIEPALEQSGLKAKNVTVVNINKKNVDAYIEKALDGLFKRKDLNLIQKLKIRKNFPTFLQQVAEGHNARFVPKKRRINLNIDKASFAAFHEMGHAMNTVSAGLKNKISTLRFQTAKAVIPILGLSLLHTTKEERKTDKYDKVLKPLDFIKKHAGLLTFGAMLPTVLDEGFASLNANKIMKPVLSEKCVRQVNKLNSYAWTTYMFAATLTGVLVHSAVKLRDKIATNNLQKEVKNA